MKMFQCQEEEVAAFVGKLSSSGALSTLPCCHSCHAPPSIKRIFLIFVMVVTFPPIFWFFDTNLNFAIFVSGPKLIYDFFCSSNLISFSSSKIDKEFVRQWNIETTFLYNLKCKISFKFIHIRYIAEIPLVKVVFLRLIKTPNHGRYSRGQHQQT